VVSRSLTNNCSADVLGPLDFARPTRTLTAHMEPLKVGVIGGSGLGQLLGGAASADAKRHAVDTPFGPPSDVITEVEWAGVPVLLLGRHGPGHVLSPSRVPYRANVFALKQLGCTHVIATGAVGSLREEFKPRDLVVPDGAIDKTYLRPSTFYDGAAVHVGFDEPFCPVLRRLLLDAAAPTPEGATHAVHDRGCYVAMEGPAFSTRSESLMHRLWGGDLIGMTALPEAKLAREAELSYALLALVTDYDSWRPKPEPDATQPPPPAPDPSALLAEIIANLQAASANAMALIRRAVELMADRREPLLAAPSRQALRLAIWSDKSAIAPAEVDRLAPLWGRYFTPGEAMAESPKAT
jgi:5'-methylthioadenosine phosphorylase